MNTFLSWKDLLFNEKKKPYFTKILKTIKEERNNGICIYPSDKDIFNAFRFTKYSDIKVVILGQDPYYCPGQANGLAFSVSSGIIIPPSLRNIYKELKRSISGFVFRDHGNLKNWAIQGVLLLNTILTVRKGKAHSHAHLGWEIFTDKIISLINNHRRNVVFLLWGAHAKKKSILINKKRHYVLYAPHPSPLSANLGFIGCDHFIKANRWLEIHGEEPINWKIPFCSLK